MKYLKVLRHVSNHKGSIILGALYSASLKITIMVLLYPFSFFAFISSVLTEI